MAGNVLWANRFCLTRLETINKVLNCFFAHKTKNTLELEADSDRKIQGQLR